RCTARRSSRLEIFPHQPVERTVDPLAVPPVGEPPGAFVDEAGPLGVVLRPLVEAVDLELETVEAQVEKQVTLKQLRRIVGDSVPPKVRMDREIAEVRDAGTLVGELEAHPARTNPAAVPLDLDHEPSELLRLGLRAIDLREQPVAVSRPRARHIGLDVLVRHQLNEKVDVAAVGATEPDPVAGDDAHALAAARAASRRHTRNPPHPSP